MTKRIREPITGTRLRLRLLEREDLPLTLRWRNLEHIRRWFKTSTIIDYDSHLAWYEKYLLNPNDFVFIIEWLAPSIKVIGQISVYNIDWERSEAEFGRLLIGDDSYIGRGIAREASQLLLGFCGDQLAINRVYLEVKEDNARALRLYEGLGFVRTRLEADMVVMEFNSLIYFHIDRAGILTPAK